MLINPNSEAYNTGYEAFLQGDAYESCPYAAGTWDCDNWQAGWKSAQA